MRLVLEMSHNAKAVVWMSMNLIDVIQQECRYLFLFGWARSTIWHCLSPAAPPVTASSRELVTTHPLLPLHVPWMPSPPDTTHGSPEEEIREGQHCSQSWRSEARRSVGRLAGRGVLQPGARLTCRRGEGRCGLEEEDGTPPALRKKGRRRSRGRRGSVAGLEEGEEAQRARVSIATTMARMPSAVPPRRISPAKGAPPTSEAEHASQRRDNGGLMEEGGVRRGRWGPTEEDGADPAYRWSTRGGVVRREELRGFTRRKGWAGKDDSV
jgi:hypothetical protein